MLGISGTWRIKGKNGEVQWNKTSLPERFYTFVSVAFVSFEKIVFLEGFWAPVIEFINAVPFIASKRSNEYRVLACCERLIGEVMCNCREHEFCRTYAYIQ